MEVALSSNNSGPFIEGACASPRLTRFRVRGASIGGGGAEGGGRPVVKGANKRLLLDVMMRHELSIASYAAKAASRNVDVEDASVGGLGSVKHVKE